MSKLFFIPFLLITSFCIKAQNVGIGTTSPNANAALEISSSNKGLLIPRTSTASRTAIVAPPKGLMVYDSSFSAFYFFDGGRWLSVGEKNYDSAVIDYSSQASNSVSLPITTNSDINLTGSSGFIYDNGGAAGNYLANSNSTATMNLDDSVIAVKITVEEMNAESLYDSLFILSYYFTNYPTFKVDTIVLTGNTTGVYTLKNINNFQVRFKSNFQNQAAGFKIRWGLIRAVNTEPANAALYGWQFNPNKLAVMGGKPNGNNWQTDSIGFGSFSYGIGNKAKGKHSFAEGYYSNATGNYSLAMGNLVNAAGENSFAVGKQVNASGQFSVAMGYQTNATGYNSTALGQSTSASGLNSIAIGSGSIASGNNSTAFGESSIASGFNSIAMGLNTLASGNQATVMGANTIASGDLSTAMGYNSTASGSYSTAMGYLSLAIGDYSISMGNGTRAIGNNSTTMGYNTTANSSYSTAMGYNTIANGYIGLVAGVYNDSISAKQTALNSFTPLFIIGNGNSTSDRTNAMVVLKNGNVAIGDNGNPVNKLQITGTINNVSLLDGSGMMTLGYTSSTNMVIDQNDIQVRLSGAVSDLNLQRLGGNIGIGNTGVPAYQLELSTNSAGKPGTNTWTIASDRRLKQNINPFTQGLQQLLQINPVTYHYNEQSGFDTKPEYVGIIAQELQQFAPYMVSTVKRKDADYLSVDNGAMTYMLINAVKEQQAQIEKLKTEMELLKNRR